MKKQFLVELAVPQFGAAGKVVGGKHLGYAWVDAELTQKVEKDLIYCGIPAGASKLFKAKGIESFEREVPEGTSPVVDVEEPKEWAGRKVSGGGDGSGL